MAPTLGYWNLRGLVEPIRYLLNYVNVDYEDKRYSSQEEWKDDKFNLGLDFPNLPYWIDGDVKLTQSLAILKYLARKYDLYAKDKCETVKMDIVEQTLVDMRLRLFMTAGNPDYEKAKEEFIESFPRTFKQWADQLGDNKYLFGDRITYVDFLAYEIFDFYEMFHLIVFQDFPTIKEYQRRMERLPGIQRYITSPRFKRWPIIGRNARFGASGDAPPKVP